MTKVSKRCLKVSKVVRCQKGDKQHLKDITVSEGERKNIQKYPKDSINCQKGVQKGILQSRGVKGRQAVPPKYRKDTAVRQRVSKGVSKRVSKAKSPAPFSLLPVGCRRRVLISKKAAMLEQTIKVAGLMECKVHA